MAGKETPNAPPIDNDTKASVKNQIDQTMRDRKSSPNGAKRWRIVMPDVTKAWLIPQAIYPGSQNIS